MTRGVVQFVTGGQLIDAAYPPAGWWEDFPACGRYSSWPPNNPKNIYLGEIDRAAAMDHGFMWFVEQSENTPINNTTDDDRRLASVSAQMAADFGKPPEAPHMFAVDTDGRAYMDQIRAAFVTYRTVIPSNEPIGLYGGSHVIDQLIDDGTIEYGHIAGALSWSSTTQPVDNITVFRNRGVTWYRTPAAHLFQYPSEAYRSGRIDRNDVLKPMPVWFPGRTTPTPNPGGTDVPTVITVTGTMTLISPSSPGTHVTAFWIRTNDELVHWNAGDYGPVDHQEISTDQCGGIRLSGPCPMELRHLFHSDSPFDGTDATGVPQHVHDFSAGFSGTVSGTSGPPR
jgi:hypothetical protein